MSRISQGTHFGTDLDLDMRRVGTGFDLFFVPSMARSTPGSEPDPHGSQVLLFTPAQLYQAPMQTKWL